MEYRMFCVFIFATLLFELGNVQAELGIFFEDVQAPIVSKNYIKDMETYMNENDLGAYFNFTIIKRFPDTTMLLAEIIGASLGQYVVHTGFSYKMPFCEVFSRNFELIGDTLKKLGFDPDNCPPPPGVFGGEHIYVDKRKLPDTFPSNKYKAVIRIFTVEEIIVQFDIYYKIA